MKNWKNKIIFLTVFFLLSAVYCLSEMTVESSVQYRAWGFKNSRTESDTDLDQINIEKTNLLLTFPFIHETLLVTGYKYSYILKSQLFAHILYKKNKISIESGLSLGFFNELPINLIPGIYGKADVQLGKSFIFSMYGNTSFYIHPLISLSSQDCKFDQNLFGFSSSFIIKDAILSYHYENENIRINTSSTTYKNNIKKIYEITVGTDLKDLWINSRTGVGVKIADFKTESVHQRLLGVYIEETLIFKIKNVFLSTGVKSTILNITLKDISSTSPPKTPAFSFYTGIKFPI